MSLDRAFKKDNVKSVAKNKRDFNYDGKHTFYRFYKGYDEFQEMLSDAKYNRMKEFNKLLLDFKAIKIKKKETQLKKERIMRNVDGLDQKYYYAYKSNYDTDGKLHEAKKKKLGHKQF